MWIWPNHFPLWKYVSGSQWLSQQNLDTHSSLSTDPQPALHPTSFIHYPPWGSTHTEWILALPACAKSPQRGCFLLWICRSPNHLSMLSSAALPPQDLGTTSVHDPCVLRRILLDNIFCYFPHWMWSGVLLVLSMMGGTWLSVGGPVTSGQRHYSERITYIPKGGHFWDDLGLGEADGKPNRNAEDEHGSTVHGKDPMAWPAIQGSEHIFCCDGGSPE